jgi:hypothetical protein
MPIIQTRGKKILFVHIPKTGGASIEHFFRKSGKVSMFDGRVANPDFRCPPQHFHLALLKQLVPFDMFDCTFTVVRNPFKRLASEYRMRNRHRFLNGQDIPDFEAWVADIFGKYAEDPWVANNHIRPQTEFVDDTVRVFRFEDGLVPIVENVCRDLSLEVPPDMTLPHRQKSVDIPVALSARSTRMVLDFYEKDFRMFDYPAQPPGVL